MLGGYGAGRVLEVVEDHAGDTYRAVYTVRFARAVVVLHCFQKKSKRGGAVPQEDRALLATRLRAAQARYDQWLEQQEVEP